MKKIQELNILIFTGGLFPQPEKASAILSRLPNPQCIIAADSGLEACEQFGLAPDYILGDFDSLKDKSRIDFYSKKPGVIIEKFIQDKDFTDTELALQKAYFLAKQAGKKANVTLIGGDGGRLDHLLGILETFSTPTAPQFWLLKEQLVCYLQKGHKLVLEGIKPDSCISIARTSRRNYGGKIKSQGLEWEHPHFRRKGMPSISNRISKSALASGQSVQLHCITGNFLAIVGLDVKIKDLST